MKTPIARSLPSILLACGFWPLAAQADPAVTVTVNMSGSNGAVKHTSYAGISVGTKTIEADYLGAGSGHMWNPSDTQLVTLLENAGLHHLRIGGSPVDNAIPLTDYGYTEIDDFFNFASTIGANVLYSLRLLPQLNSDGTFTYFTTEDTSIAEHIWNNSMDKAALEAFAIGNEPDLYPTSIISGYNSGSQPYLPIWKTIANSISSQIDPNNTSSNFDGADATPGNDWTIDFINSKQSGAIAQQIYNATEHYYVGSDTDTIDQHIKNMLSAAWVDSSYPNYNSGHVGGLGWGYRFTETDDCTGGNTTGGGIAGASDVFASAMWGLDFACWWAQQDHCKGVNFHCNIDPSFAYQYPPTTGPWYYDAGPSSMIYVDSGGNWQVHPKWAAIKMVSLLYTGTTNSRPITNVSNPSGVNVTYYGSGDSSNCYALVINKSNSVTGDGTGVNLTVKASGFTAHNAEYIRMRAYPTVDDPTQPGAQVGGATISNSSSWSGTWTAISVSSNSVNLPLQQCGAVLVHMY